MKASYFQISHKNSEILLKCVYSFFFSYEKNEAWLSSAVQLKVKSKLESHLKHNGSPGVVGTTTAKTKQNKKLPKECKQRMVMLVKSTTVN